MFFYLKRIGWKKNFVLSSQSEKKGDRVEERIELKINIKILESVVIPEGCYRGSRKLLQAVH